MPKTGETTGLSKSNPSNKRGYKKRNIKLRGDFEKTERLNKTAYPKKMSECNSWQEYEQQGSENVNVGELRGIIPVEPFNKDAYVPVVETEQVDTPEISVKETQTDTWGSLKNENNISIKTSPVIPEALFEPNMITFNASLVIHSEKRGNFFTRCWSIVRFLFTGYLEI